VNVTIHSHNVPLDQTLKDYAEAKLRRLDRHFDRIVDARLEFDLDGRKSIDPQKVACLYVHVNGAQLSGKVKTRGDLRESIDLVVDKVDQQLRRRKERLTAHRPNPRGA
jgi:putative sigma-54 modulation protein